VFDSCLAIKDRVLRAAQVKMWNSAYLKVSYGNGIFNDGCYCSLLDFKNALSVFTEKALVDYLQNKR